MLKGKKLPFDDEALDSRLHHIYSMLSLSHRPFESFGAGHLLRNTS